MSAEQIEYHDRINAEFAEAVYQEMASTRYGIDFCCSPDLTKWTVKKELLDLNALQVDICPDPNNPAQPGDPNYVSRGCGRLDISTTEQGGTVSYVPCGAFYRVTETYTGNGLRSICYDKSAGYTVTPATTGCASCIVATESEVECTTDNFCREYTFSVAKAGGSITYTDCEGVEHYVELPIGPASFGPVCVREGQYSVTEEFVDVISIGECSSVCRLIGFTQGRGNNQITYVDCNDVERVVDLPQFETAGPFCLKSWTALEYSQLTTQDNGECTG